MKQTKACPKCGCTELLRVEDYTPNGITLVLDWLTSVPVTRYVCTGCGYVESWVDERHMSDIRLQYRVEQLKK